MIYYRIRPYKPTVRITFSQIVKPLLKTVTFQLIGIHTELIESKDSISVDPDQLAPIIKLQHWNDRKSEVDGVQ